MFNQQNNNGFAAQNNNGFNQQQQNPQQGFNQQQGGAVQQQQFNQQPQNNGGFNQQPQGNFAGGQASNNMEMFVDMNEQASTGYGMVPEGRYPLEISASEFGPNSGGTGNLLKLQFTIISGEFAGRTLFGNYNLIMHGQDEKSRQAQQIAQREYAALCKALYGEGFRETNPAKLIGLKFIADVDNKPEKKKQNQANGWGDAEQSNEPPKRRNNITCYSPFQVAQQQQPASPMGQQQFTQQQAPVNQQPQNQQFNQQQQAPVNQQQQNPGFQQQPNTGVQFQEQNQQQQNGGGNQALPQGGANGFAGNVDQQQQQQQQQQAPQNNGGWNPGNGSQFPSM